MLGPILLIFYSVLISSTIVLIPKIFTFLLTELSFSLIKVLMNLEYSANNTLIEVSERLNTNKLSLEWKRHNLNVIIHYSFTFFGRYSLFISIFFQLFIIYFRSQRELNACKTQLRGLRCFIIKLGSH